MNLSKSAVLLFLFSVTASRADTLVVPENTTITDGAGVVNVGSGTSGRYQEVFSATSFQNIDSPILITDFAWRKGASDGSVTGELDIPSVQIQMSTTTKSPANLSVPLDGNVGSSLASVFPAGPLSITFGGKTGVFDIKFALAHPYLYDPRNGNLLIDIRFTSPANGGTISLGKIDVANGPVGLGIEANGGAMAGFAGPVTAFTFSLVPEPSSVTLALYGFFGMLAFHSKAQLSNLKYWIQNS